MDWSPEFEALRNSGELTEKELNDFFSTEEGQAYFKEKNRGMMLDGSALSRSDQFYANNPGWNAGDPINNPSLSSDDRQMYGNYYNSNQDLVDWYSDARKDGMAVGQGNYYNAYGTNTDGWEENWLKGMNDYYKTGYTDVGQFTEAQMGKYHYDTYGQKEGRELTMYGQPGPGTQAPTPTPTPTPEPTPAPAPTPTPSPSPNQWDWSGPNITWNGMDISGNGGAGVIGGGSAIGGNNDINIEGQGDKTWSGDVTVEGDNWGNVNSDFSVNFNWNDFMNTSGGSGPGGYDAGASMMNSYATAWNGIASNENRANRDPNQFTKRYMQGMAMSGLI